MDKNNKKIILGKISEIQKAVKEKRDLKEIVAHKDELFALLARKEYIPKDGKDGYTPIKGVDYFDGEKGEDGVSIKGDKGDSIKGDNGENGKDGKDGISIKGDNGLNVIDGSTPIKGVDYFTEAEIRELTDFCVKELSLSGERIIELISDPNIPYDKRLSVLVLKDLNRLNTNANGGVANSTTATVTDASIEFSDITTNNFSITKHGFVPKGTNVGNFLRDDGTWANPSDVFAIWGGITGTLANQTDLQNALDLKLNVSAKATGANINTGTDDTKYVTAKAIADSNIAFLSDIPVISDRISLITQTADIADTAFSISGTGLYRVSYYVLNTTADLTAGAITLNIKYTDNTTSRTISTSPLALTLTSGILQGSVIIRLNSGSITYGVTHTGIYGSSVYAIYLTSEQII